MQKAADAAALAGAVYLPDDPGRRHHGGQEHRGEERLPDGPRGVGAVDARLARTSSRSRSTTTVKNSFAQAVGDRHHRPRTARRRRVPTPCEHGSPLNQFGNDPELRRPRTARVDPLRRLLGDIFGPSSTEGQGRRDRVDDSSVGSDQLRQSELRLARGYFRHRVTSSAAHQSCPRTTRIRQRRRQLRRPRQQLHLIGAQILPARLLPGYPGTVATIGSLQHGGDGAYCTGDMIHSEGSNQPVDHVQVRAHDRHLRHRRTIR